MRIATKIFANGKWSLEKVTACLTFSVDPNAGELRHLNEVTCQ
jgi:hypothetical protein